MCGSSLSHHYILGSVSSFKHDDLSALEHLCMGPFYHITIFHVQFQHSSEFDLSAIEQLCMSPFYHITFSLAQFSTFKCDDFCALKHLCMGPLPHITLFWIKFQHSIMMTFLHSNIYALVHYT